MHPRNKYQGRYDYSTLIKSLPELEKCVIINPSGEFTIDYSDATAVKLLNKALLKTDYQLKYWDIPKDFLTPAIPGRAEYIHQVADLLAICNGRKVPKGPEIHLLDIGTGANFIYPIVARRDYKWSATGVDVSPEAVASANTIISQNEQLLSHTAAVLQKDAKKVFYGVLREAIFYDMVVCNPPFHSSEKEAIESSQRKQKNLKYARDASGLNFRGRSKELWCPGGEVQFVKNMIDESSQHSTSVLLYTSLISKESNCAILKKYLQGQDITQSKVISWKQGQKKSRCLAWTYFTENQMKAWRMRLSVS